MLHDIFQIAVINCGTPVSSMNYLELFSLMLSILLCKDLF